MTPRFSPLAITALTATSAMGNGLAAMRRALHQRRSGLRPEPPGQAPEGIWTGRVAGLEAAGQQAAGLEAVALPPALAGFDCRNNRLAELALRGHGFAPAVQDAVRRFGAARIGVVLGTSTSGIAETEAAYRQRDKAGALPASFNYAGSHDLYALSRFVRARLGLAGPTLTISTACTSGALAFLEGAVLLESGLCDAVVVGGVDTLCDMTLRGFASLELLSRGPCRPGDAARTGISIGEAAGFALLERPRAAAPGATPAAAEFLLLGGGASSDGHHMSSPQPEGLGAQAAMRAALASAGLGPGAIDYINLHGTGTRANDAMEDRAVSAVFGASVPCSSTKGWTGHSLGASGAVEVAVAAICLADGLVPGCLGAEAIDPAFLSDMALENRARPLRRILSNSFGFGGSNACLLLGRMP